MSKEDKDDFWRLEEIKLIEEEKRRKIDDLSDQYLVDVIRILYKGRVLNPQDLDLQKIEEEAQASIERIRPLLPVIGKVFFKPSDCNIYESSITKIATIGSATPSITSNDLGFALSMIGDIHLPKCPNPQTHQNV